MLSAAEDGSHARIFYRKECMMRKKWRLSVVTSVLMMLVMMTASLTYAGDMGESGQNINFKNILQNVFSVSDLKGVSLDGIEINGKSINDISLKDLGLENVDLKDTDLNSDEVNRRVDEYLKSRGYTDEEIYKLRSAILESLNSRISPAVKAAIEGNGKTGITGIDSQKLQEAENTESQIYVVKRGDTLSKIAKKVYGDSRKWTVIYSLNRDQIKNPDRIEIGQKLKIS